MAQLPQGADVDETRRVLSRRGSLRTSLHPTVAEVATIGAGVGGVYLVARDGSPLWQMVRALVLAAVAAGTFVALRRMHGGRRATVAFAAGVITTACGIGIALPHVAKAGFSLVTVAGVLVVVSGVALLADGAVGIVRSVRSWRRIVVVLPMVIAFFVATVVLGQAVAVTNVPRTSVGSTTPADFGLPYEDVELPAVDGVTLSGWYIPSQNGAAVALLHGAGSTRSGVLDHAVVLARNGYGVLAYDARGHGDSRGRAMDFGWYGDADLQGAVTFLQAQPEVDGARIAAVGMSMGGEQAIGAIASDERIRAVVAEGATNRVAADKAWLSDEYGVRGWVQEQLDRLVFATADLLTDADPPIALRDAVAKATPRPVLLIAAGDVEDEARAGRYIRSGSPASVGLWIVPGADHTGGLGTQPDEWEQRVIAFLDAALVNEN